MSMPWLILLIAAFLVVASPPTQAKYPDDLPPADQMAFQHTSEVLEAWRRTLHGG